MDFMSRRNLRAAVIGMVLGDATLQDRGRLKLTHSPRQREYLMMKVGLLQRLQRRELRVTEKVERTTYGSFPLLRAETVVRPIYRRLRKLMYPLGQKHITRKILDYLEPIGLAIWFMDDGSCSLKKNDRGKVSSCETTLNTYVSAEENQTIIAYFAERWNVRLGINRSKGMWRLRMGTREARKFAEIIKSYVIPSMSYKLDKLA